jgi:transcriptional regulator with XRE-family HTH domain
MPTEGLSEEALAFDLPKYGADLKRALDAAGLSYREAEQVIGVDHNTLQRVASGTRPPNVEHYLRIERWLAARAEGPAPPGGGVALDHSSVGFCAEAQSPSPSDGPVLRHVISGGSSAKPDPSCDCFHEWRECRADACVRSRSKAGPPRPHPTGDPRP